MNKLTLGDIVGICGGQFYGNQELLSAMVGNITTNLGDTGKNTLYVNAVHKPASSLDIKESTANIIKAHRNGALCCMTSKEINNPPMIRVRDIEVANFKIAEACRKLINIPIIAITGSVGKTSTKDMCNFVLSKKFSVLKTAFSENISTNYIYPMYRLLDPHDVAVIEAALSGITKYTMDENGQVLWPDMVIMTNIGESHMGIHRSQENIFKRKSLILDYLSPIGTVYLNGCDQFLKTIYLDKPKKVKMFGMSEDMEYHPENIKNLGIKGVNFDLVRKKDKINVTIPVPGLHFINAALPAFAVGLEFGLTLEEIKAGIEGFKTDILRSKVYDTGFITIIEDCYNASPTSNRANIDMLAEMDGRKVFIMGDMKELGGGDEQYHVEVAQYAAKNGIDLLIYAGKWTESISKNVLSGCTCKVISLPGKEFLFDILPDNIKKGDIILVKASRACKFDEVTDMLKQISPIYTSFQPPQIRAEGMVVLDAFSGKILQGKNAHKKYIPAGMTKIATAILAIESEKLDGIVTITEEFKVGSIAKVIVGEKIKLIDMVYGLMLSSANDLAVNIAVYISGSVAGFSNKMNTLAEKIGMKNTFFSNPYGCGEENHLTTPCDTALLLRYAMQNPVFREIVKTPVWKCFSSVREHGFNSTNELIRPKPGRPDRKYGPCIGGKTGSWESGNQQFPCLSTLATYAVKNGKEHIMVQMNVLGKTRKDCNVKFDDAKKLHEWAFNNHDSLMNKSIVINE